MFLNTLMITQHGHAGQSPCPRACGAIIDKHEASAPDLWCPASPSALSTFQLELWEAFGSQHETRLRDTMRYDLIGWTRAWRSGRETRPPRSAKRPPLAPSPFWRGRGAAGLRARKTQAPFTQRCITP